MASASGQNIYVRSLDGQPSQRRAIMRFEHVHRTFDHVGYGLVMDGLRPMQKGDPPPMSRIVRRARHSPTRRRGDPAPSSFVAIATLAA